MKKAFVISVVSMACVASFAQDVQPDVSSQAASIARSRLAERELSRVDASKEKGPSVFIPKKGAIVIPAKPSLQVVAKPVSVENSGVAPGAIKLPIEKPLAAETRELPGLGMMPGVITENKIKSVKVGTDRNERIYISQSQLNKIATPFTFPKAVDVTGASLKVVGQDVFIQPSSEQPVTIYISDNGVGQSVGLTLVPVANLPAQSIVIEPDASTNKIVQPQIKTDDLIPSDYVGRITSHIKQLALGKTPSGFTRSSLPTATAVNKQMMFATQHKYVGSTYDIFSYKLTSISTSPVELSEETFYTPNVRAVAFFPSAMLQRGESTTVFVIADHAEAAK